MVPNWTSHADIWSILRWKPVRVTVTIIDSPIWGGGPSDRNRFPPKTLSRILNSKVWNLDTNSQSRKETFLILGQWLPRSFKSNWVFQFEIKSHSSILGLNNSNALQIVLRHAKDLKQKFKWVYFVKNGCKEVFTIQSFDLNFGYDYSFGMKVQGLNGCNLIDYLRANQISVINISHFLVGAIQVGHCTIAWVKNWIFERIQMSWSFWSRCREKQWPALRSRDSGLNFFRWFKTWFWWT